MAPRGPFDERGVNGPIAAETLVSPQGAFSPGNRTVPEGWVNGR